MKAIGCLIVGFVLLILVVVACYGITFIGSLQ